MTPVVGLNYLRPDEAKTIGGQLVDALKTNFSLYQLEVSENEFGKKYDDAISMYHFSTLFLYICLYVYLEMLVNKNYIFHQQLEELQRHEEELKQEVPYQIVPFSFSSISSLVR